MATVNKVDFAVMQVLQTSEPRIQGGAAQMPGYPLAVANHEVTTGAKLTLAGGTRGCLIGCVSGAIYAISGVEGDSNISAGGGFYCPAGQVTAVPVRTGDTHLLVIAAA